MNNNNNHNKQFHWKRIYNSWIFWFILFLMILAIIYYVVSTEFIFAPQIETMQPPENISTS